MTRDASGQRCPLSYFNNGVDMPFKKGQIANPNGAPKKERALSHIIEVELSHTVQVGDKKIARKRLMGRLLAEAVSTGKITFCEAEGLRILKLDAGEWVDMVMKLLRHIEGEKHQIEAEIQGDFSQRVEGFQQMLERVYGNTGNVPDNPENK
jgi:uncharacterized protein (DUF1501 family)